MNRLNWIEKARPEQLRPEGSWRIWLILSGRGWGKTRTAAEDCADYAAFNPGAHIAVIASTTKDLRETVLEGPSGILKRLPEGSYDYNRSFGEIRLWNDTIIHAYSAEEPDRLRGPNFNRAYADELASWKKAEETWDMLNFALRIGSNPQCIITTTPRPTKIIRDLATMSLTDKTVILTRGSTYDNAANLGKGFLDYLKDKYEGTRIGRQEIDGEILGDTPGALWNRAQLDELRVRAPPELRRIVVAVDPAITNTEGSDETGIVAAGRGVDGHYYVLSDRSGRYSPDGWAREAIAQYDLLEANKIVAEANQGGDMVERTLRVVKSNIPISLVRASRGKVTRAEPVAALYEQGKVHHVGTFPKLEDQMTNFTSDFDKSAMGYSPDRVDALVWAIVEIMEKKSGFFDL